MVALREVPQDIRLLDFGLTILKQWKNIELQRVVYYDSRYPTQFISNPLDAKNYFLRRGFVQKDADALKDWMLYAIRNNTAHQCLVVFIQDVVPETVFESTHPSCFFRRFLDRGGTIVWRGDIPLFYRGKPTGGFDKIDITGAWEILGVSYQNFTTKSKDSRIFHIWDSDFSLEITEAGKQIGLEKTGTVKRPVRSDQVSVSFIRTKKPILVEELSGNEFYFSTCWKKNFSNQHPYSGLLQYQLGPWDGADEEDLSNFLNFSLSSISPLYFSAPATQILL